MTIEDVYTMSNEPAHHVLKNIFGFASFRPLQKEIIASILAKNDTLVILPTGGGKSLCYQIPAIIFKGLTVVISPLIALMKDQVDQMEHVGVPAVMLNSSLDARTYRRNVERITSGQARLLNVAPETMMMSRSMDLLARTSLACLAIDEAHCISEWGHDFRPEYRRLVQIREKFPRAVCAALTATATPRVRQDIQTTLGFRHADTFIGSFNRENLFLEITAKDNPMATIQRVLKKYPDQTGIIYCATRQQVDDLALALQTGGVNALPYHAGMTGNARKTNQERFIRDDVRIIVATIAFGMGIDKPDVRFVIHFDLPKNIESYYQEIGRAGRDGLPADCLLLFSYADVYKIKHFIQQKAATECHASNIHLNAFLRYAEWQGCRRVPLLQYFGESPVTKNCRNCDNCIDDDKKQIDVTVLAQKFLSCVYRTGQRFGAAHIISVLRGSKAERVLQLNHHQLSTYAIGQELSKSQWQSLSRQFLHQGLLIEDMDYGGFQLGPHAKEVLKGKKKVRGWLEAAELQPVEKSSRSRIRTRIKTGIKTGIRKAEEPPGYDHDLFARLKAKRKEVADRENVPPYVVFPDKTLLEMATYFPQSKENLLQIHGVGAAKLATYGSTFIGQIIAYCRKRGIDAKEKSTPTLVAKSTVKTKKKRHVVIGETFNAGRSVVELMEMFAIKRKTVLNHLFKFWCEGHELASDSLGIRHDISPEQTEMAFKQFEKMGIQRLKSVFDLFSGDIDYTELAALRLLYIARTGLMADTSVGPPID